MTSNVTCTQPELQWSFNTLNQSPCQIAASLAAVCNAGQFIIAPLDPNKVYIGPTLDEANQCACSGVFYNLVSACADCQGRNWLDWSEFNANCSTIYPTIFLPNIPSTTRVPHWAFDDPTNSTFNPALAQEVTDAPESTGPSQSTGTSSNPTLTPASSESSSSKAGPIAGGVVGGVVGLALIAALVFWWIRRRRLGIAPSAEVNYTSVAPTSPPPMSFTAAPLGSSANITSQRFYDPSDPSTYPAPINAPATDYTGSNQVLLTHVTGSTYPGSTVPAGRYTGAPEL
ncbi:hypothetical protein E4T56_gene11235 [Termitomyces sp. T112]|nr:hypothetical protein E4T56_gene11235 [Termitomyces sp. T112]KAH0583719.1 hypothetical protein H2248_009325 [Termitomyces sp. 'cryptogamus']